MRRWALLIALFALLPGAALAEEGVQIYPRAAAPGELIWMKAPAGLTYVYSMYRDDVLLFEGEMCTEQIVCFRPRQRGQYRVEVAVTDAAGRIKRAKGTCWVAGEWVGNENLSLSGDTAHFYAEGGFRRYVVRAQGEWTAEASDGFLQLSRYQGQSGDVLVVSALENEGEKRTGTLTVHCGDEMLALPFIQSDRYDVEEEAYLERTDDVILIDGKTHISWMGASGGRNFAVTASGDWQAACDSDFVTLTQGRDLCVTVAENTSEAVRDAVIVLNCGKKQAFIHISQMPAAQENTLMYANIASDVQCNSLGITVYSQQDGSWQDAAYAHSDLQQSGCAIFTLSHALQLLGYEAEETAPENLAKRYADCLLEGGTLNSALIEKAGEDFGFKTRFDLYKDLETMRKKLQSGALYSFAVVQGHIALVAGLSEDGSKCLIVDSAPSATFERIKNGTIYYRNDLGEFVIAESPAEIPGCVYYPETGGYGGCAYYLDARYVARRGVRILQPTE